MSAFRRRTAFAAPLIISVVAGCSKENKEEEFTRNPPPPERPEPIKNTNPPEPQVRTTNPPTPAPSKFKVTWDVRRIDSGICEAGTNVECDPGEKCNPPAPRAIQCPPGTSGKTVIRVGEVATNKCVIVPKGCEDTSCVKLETPCPLPHGEKLPPKLVEVWTVEKNKNGDGGCHAEEPDVDCPPNTDCNPPMPMKIKCPPGMTETSEIKVGKLPDKTCAILPDGCNAPTCATTKVDCPAI